MPQPLAIDLYCGLGGWAEGFLSEGYRVVGFDIVRHDYGFGDYPGELILEDVLSLHGSQFADARVIVASPPCQEFSYMAMPWSRAKERIRQYESGELDVKQLTALFDACFRIQREASEAASHHIPLIVENVRGAQRWVGRAKWHFGSYYLWGDVPALMPMTICRNMKSNGGTHASTEGPGRPRFITEEPELHVSKELRLSESRTGNGRSIGQQYLSDSQSVSVISGGLPDSHGSTNPAEHIKQGGDWFGRECESSMSRLYGSKSIKRKAASALIAKIPFPLAQHIARVFGSNHDPAAGVPGRVPVESRSGDEW